MEQNGEPEMSAEPRLEAVGGRAKGRSRTQTFRAGKPHSMMKEQKG